jgi:hypothetical protein
MTLRNDVLRFGLVMLVSLAAGCQNTLTVRVEKIMGVSASRLRPESRLGRALDARIKDLSSFSRSCGTCVDAIDRFVAEFPTEKQDIASASLESERSLFVELRSKASELRTACRQFYKSDKIMQDAPDVRATIRQVDEFFERALEDVRYSQEAMRERNALAKLLKSAGIDEGTDEFKRLQAMVEHSFDSAEASAAGAKQPEMRFGGFIATDVYVINPSDPAFQEVLGDKKKLSVRPITRATVGVTGDSAVMMVLEHPGQVRTFQISMDPAQIARNIASIVSKATAAAAKFVPLF